MKAAQEIGIQEENESGAITIDLWGVWGVCVSKNY